ncbi:MAG: ABC transporter substrate-binding protein [Alphaproteobacteria bacterium]
MDVRCDDALKGSLAAGLAVALALLAAQPVSAADTIRCAYPYWFGFAPVPVAIEMGYFAEEGLEVTTVYDNDRANVMPAFESGDLDCTMRTIGEHMSRPLEVDSNLTIIGTIDVSIGADGVVAGPEITSVADLVGKTFAGEINHPGTVMTAHALRQMGKSFEDVDLRLIATDDSAAVFEDTSVAAVATWEPMMSEIVDNTSRTGSHILLSSADFNGLITDVVIVRKDDFQANPEKYAKFLRGIYRAVDLFNKDPDKFLAVAAPAFEVTPEQMKVDIGGLVYTSYEDTIDFMGSGGSKKLAGVIDSLNTINVELDLMDDPLGYDAMVDSSLVDALFVGHKR